MTAAPAPPAVLSVRDLRVGVEAAGAVTTIVHDVSFDVAAGEFVGIVGESGAGKSTLTQAMIGLARRPIVIEHGAVLLAGETDLVRIGDGERRALRCTDIGYVGQNPFGSLHPILPLWKQFLLVERAHQHRVSKPRSFQRACAALEAVGMRDPERILRGFPHQLSGGMAQRVVIAIAFLLGPRLIVADEPTTGLDLTVQRQLLDLLRGRAEHERASVVVVTHDLGVVAQYCRRVLVLYGGRLVEAGPVHRVFTMPAHPYTAALLASVPEAGGLQTSPTRVERADVQGGCVYRGRCPRADDVCAMAPVLSAVGSGVEAACHHPLSEGP